MVGERFKSFHVTDPDGWNLQTRIERTPGPVDHQTIQSGLDTCQLRRHLLAMVGVIP